MNAPTKHNARIRQASPVAGGDLARYYNGLISDLIEFGWAIVPTRVVALNAIRMLQFMGDKASFELKDADVGVKIILREETSK